MLTAVIVDEERLAVDMLRLFLMRCGQVQILGEYYSSSEALQQIEKLRPEVVFLDVEMRGINGLEMAERLIERFENIQIVFVTAYREYAVEAFALNAVDYLIKPTSQKSIDRAVSRLLERKNMMTRVAGKSSAQIYCFGQMRLLVGGRLVKWRTAKVEELFAYLLHHQGTIVSKEEIIECVWAEFDGKPIGNNLYNTVYRLKKTLRENGLSISVKRSGDGYILELGEEISWDIGDFSTFINEAERVNQENIEEFEKMTALYQGDYFENKDYLWCITDRTRLQKNFLDIIKRMAYYYIKAAEYKKAEQILLNNIKLWSYDEEAYAILFEAFFLQGDRAAIIKYYAQLKEILESELGYAPQPSLKRRYEELISSF